MTKPLVPVKVQMTVPYLGANHAKTLLAGQATIAALASAPNRPAEALGLAGVAHT
jgi:hypothetical protein